MRNHHLCLYLQFVLLFVSCEKYSPELFAIEAGNTSAIADTTIYLAVSDHPGYTVICGSDSTNAKSFARFLSSYERVVFSDDDSNGNGYEFIIGRTGRPESSLGLESIDGYGYIVKAELNKLIITGTDETWTAIALYAFEDYCRDSGMAEQDSLLTIPHSLVLKEEYDDPQLFSRLIQRGYSFTIDPEFVLSCPGHGNCTIGQGATSDGKYFYIINKNSNDDQSVIFRFDIESLQWKGRSPILNTGHSNDLTYNPDLDLIVVAHGQEQGQVLTLVNATTFAAKDIQICVGASSVSYNAAIKQYAFSQGGTTLHFTDDRFNLIKTFTRKPPAGYTAQGMGADDSFIYFPMSSNRANVIDIYDWEGQYVTTLHLPFTKESETLFYSAGEYYMNFNHRGSELYRLKPVFYYVYDQ